jgi:hypothetical protein
MSDVIVEPNSKKVDRRLLAAALKAAGGNLKKVSVPPALSNRRSAEEFVQLITGCRARAVENIVAIGQHLREAREELDHGEFGPMLKRIGFSEGTARKYMAIAAHPLISNRSNWNALPPSWTTLYELTKVPPDVLEARIADGTVTPELGGTEVAALDGEPQGPSRAGRGRDISYDIAAASSRELTSNRALARDFRVAELEAKLEAAQSEVEALRAELEHRASPQPNNGMPVRVIEPITEEDRQELERAGQQRLPFEWEIGADAACAREAVA